MLIQLNIKNFALIEEVNMEFKEGFNILSGETGAGKSILIDAIDFVLGGKFSKDIIRTNADKTFVEAIFSIDNDKIKSILDELEIEYEDILIISRESTLSGKNIIKVNGKSLIVMQLKKIREKILDIHGQHQNQNLLQRSIHIEYLDNYIGEKINEPLKNFLKLKEELSEIIDRISKINGEEGNEKLIDYTKFQIDDIEKAKLKSGEEEELKMEYEKLSNAEKINSALRVSFGLLNSREDGNSILECLSKVISELSSVSNNVKDIEEKKQAIEEAYYILEESSRDIRDMAEEIVYDEDKLSKINERIYEINTYKKKYGKTVEEVIEYYNSLCKQYDDLINAKEVIKKLELEKEEILLKMKKEGEILHKLRVNSKQLLETKILDELAYVGLDKSRMEIQVNMSENYNERGFDEVAFFISTNPGEPLKPLEKVLSGGELSRIMLALKCVFADKEEISTLIFDEIDTGISGQVGQRVGEKMYQVSLGHQVLCITHLPQIAILSDYHYFVSKEVVDGKTYTKVKLLEEEDKIKQVASMLGGDDVTDTTIKNVREMLEFSINKKNEIKNIYNS
ncbi:MAG: DNA repair protein RecN [Clostridium sp.]|nr:DNA repair protein RecN [Clostridium sp.]MDY3827829.1 DNA repair protein RecN [Clostridium sp.]